MAFININIIELTNRQREILLEYARDTREGVFPWDSEEDRLLYIQAMEAIYRAVGWRKKRVSAVEADKLR